MSGLLSLWQISRSLCKGAGKSLAPGQKLRALFLNAQTRLRALTSRRWALGVAARRPHRAEACNLLQVLRLLRVLRLLLPVLATRVAEKWKRPGRASGRKPGGGGDGTLGESALQHTLGAPSWGRRPDPGRGVTARDCQPGHQDRQDFLQALGTWKPGVLGDITSTAADRGPTAHSGLGHGASGPMGPQRLFLRPEEATCCFTGEAAKNP